MLGATGGLVAGAVIDAPLTMKCVMAAVGAFGGLLADSDTASSTVGQLLPREWHRRTPGHRRITHSLPYSAGVLLVALAVQWAGVHYGKWAAPEKSWVPIALVAGQMTHLLADGLTAEGVPLFYPFWKRRIRLLGPLSFTTGTATEHVVVVTLLSLAGGYLMLPLGRELVGQRLHSPLIWGVHVESLIIFAMTVGVSAVLLVLYSLSRSGGRRRARSRGRVRTSASRSRRRPRSRV